MGEKLVLSLYIGKWKDAQKRHRRSRRMNSYTICERSTAAVGY
jgi:hypothetical protein